MALASGIAVNGGKPVYGVYSTFVQRAFDQLSQDLCINNSPATILVYAASIYGMNDVTHLGIYDIPMMANIPNLVYLAPTTKEEYLAMLDWSLAQRAHPVAHPRAGRAFGVERAKPVTKDFSKLNQFEVVQRGNRAAILALGAFFPLGKAAAQAIAVQTSVQPTLINPRYISGLDVDLLEQLQRGSRGDRHGWRMVFWMAVLVKRLPGFMAAPSKGVELWAAKEIFGSLRCGGGFAAKPPDGGADCRRCGRAAVQRKQVRS